MYFLFMWQECEAHGGMGDYKGGFDTIKEIVAKYSDGKWNIESSISIYLTKGRRLG